METINLYCIMKHIMLLGPGECLSCDFKDRAIHKDKGWISCPNIRIAERLKYNTVMPLEKEEMRLRDFLPGEKKEQLDILIVRKGGGLGDIVTTTVAVRGVREKFPDATISYHCSEKYRCLLDGNPDIDKVVTKVDKMELSNYTLVIELDNPCPCYIYEARNIHNPRGIVRPRVDLFCERAGVDLENKLPSVEVSREESRWAEEFLYRKWGKKNKIAICPTSFEMMKSWPIPRVKKLIPKITKKLKATVFIFHDKPIDVDGAIGIFGYPLKKVVALINKMDLVVSVDTGFIHLAGALGIPLIGLWGVNEPRRVMAHYKNVSWIWKKDRFKCSPCYYLHTCMKSPTPCMEAITAEDVFNEIQKRMSNPSA